MSKTKGGNTDFINYNSDNYLDDKSFLPNPHNYITVRGAKEHNLQDVSVIIPKNRMTVFSGLSGSGKSSLVFDTIYAEGQRRYVESLSSYARQFLGMKDKPDVSRIEGLSPAISIDQKSTSQNPRSTVGTITEIYDYLRLLYAKIGIQYDINTGEELKVQSVSQMADRVMKMGNGGPVILLAPIVNDRKGWHKQTLLDAKKAGFRRIRIDGKIILLQEAEKLDLKKSQKHTIEFVVDRVSTTKEDRIRLLDALDSCLKHGDGKALVVSLNEDNKRLAFDQNQISNLEVRQFSFNSPHGACSRCSGLGVVTQVDSDLIVPNDNLSIAEGCIRPFSKITVTGGWFSDLLKKLAKKHKFSLKTPWRDLTKKQREIILNGGDKDFEGIVTNLERRYKETASDSSRKSIESYMTKKACPLCNGDRLRQESLHVYIAEKNIAEVSRMSIEDCYDHFQKMQSEESKLLNKNDKQIAKMILEEVTNRLKFLLNVGLGYLSLVRGSNTLSGGEAQRIRLATQIGSGLTGVLYILDEPSIGLHQRDNTKLLETLRNLCDIGNTVLVVEHDEETIRGADFLVDIGPGAGRHGGYIVATGTPEEVEQNDASPTGRFLAGKENIAIPAERRIVKDVDPNPEAKESKKYDRFINVIGASGNNLKSIDLNIPLRKFVCVSGVSGSGKSTLVNNILSNELMNYFYDSRLTTSDFDEIIGLNYIDKPIIIDQSAIGRTPRSNPATYTGLFTPIRELFASQSESKARGYEQGRFSFNVEGGRCETCHGDGSIKVEMNFLPDVYVECEDCKGKRYNRETLEIEYNGKNIADVLAMTVNEALGFFQNHKLITRKLQTLDDVGLGYVHLGQSATTLSGGEAQRVKLATELSKVGTGNTLYILDEPTTGLHPIDVKKLLEVLHRLVDKGNTVLVIEHNLDVIKTADWIVDLGPEGGDKGGEIVAVGTPEQVAQVSGSYTGRYLKDMLNK